MSLGAEHFGQGILQTHTFKNFEDLMGGLNTPNSLPSECRLVVYITACMPLLPDIFSRYISDMCRPCWLGDTCELRSLCQNGLMVPRHKLSKACGPVCFQHRSLDGLDSLTDYSCVIRLLRFKGRPDHAVICQGLNVTGIGISYLHSIRHNVDIGL